MPPKISIIIPLYNTEKYIRPCLESIYRQGLPEETFEVLVVNDGSTDKSVSIIGELARVHPNLQVIHQPNQGVSAARNHGLELANGTYIWFVDADDLLAEDSLPEMLRIAEEHTTDILKIGHTSMECDKGQDDANPSSRTPDAGETVCKSGMQGFVEDFNPRQGYVWQYLFRREFLKEKQLAFTPGVTFCEDWIFSVSALLTANRFTRIPLPVYFYRQHENSAIHTLNKKAMLSLNIVIEQAYILLHQIELDAKSQRKMRHCIYQLLTLSLWQLAHTPTLYTHRREIIADLKKRLPRFVQKHSFSEWKFSLFYSYSPYLYVWLRKSLNTLTRL